MAVANPQGAALAARAKAVGWKVTTVRGMAGAYKIWMSPCKNSYCNHILQIHNSPSDVNWHRVVERDLYAHGLAGLEAKLAKERDAERQAKLAKENKAAGDKAKQLASQATATAKATGPYQPVEDVPAEWFFTPHPAPWFRWVKMTPELADKIIKELNIDNRPINGARVEHHVNVIRSGQWRMTHQGIAFDTRGVLQDGQHRLKGIALAEETVPIGCFVGMPEENFHAIDENLVRTAAALFGKSGEKNGAALASIVRLVHFYRQDNPRTALRERTTNTTVLQMFNDDPEQFRISARWAMGNYKKIRGINPAPLGAARFLLYQENGWDNPYVEAFLRGLTTERKLDPERALRPDDPRNSAREYLDNAKDLGKRMNGLEVLALLIHCWNRVVRDERMKTYFRLAKNMPIPAIDLCRNTGVLASSCPPLLDGEVPPDSEE